MLDKKSSMSSLSFNHWMKKQKRKEIRSWKSKNWKDSSFALPNSLLQEIEILQQNAPLAEVIGNLVEHYVFTIIEEQNKPARLGPPVDVLRTNRIPDLCVYETLLQRYALAVLYHRNRVRVVVTFAECNRFRIECYGESIG